MWTVAPSRPVGRRLLGRRGVLGSLAAPGWPALSPSVPGRPRRRARILAPCSTPGLIRRAVEQAAGLDQLHSLIVARGGEIAVAETFRGPPVDRPVNVKSVSKTIVATLTGIAIDRGVIPGGIEAAVARPVAALLGDLVPADADPRVREITLGDLLTMQAGLERTSGANYGLWVASRDWVRHALTRPFVAEPGTRMQYSTRQLPPARRRAGPGGGGQPADPGAGLAGRAAGTIAVPAWTRDPQGFYLGGNNMALSPMAL